MVKVLHVLNTLEAQAGGGGEHLARLTQGLVLHGFESTVVVGYDGPIAAQLRNAGLPVTAVGPMGIRAPVRLAAVFRAVRPDLLHLHGSRAGAVGTIAARLSHVRPIVYTAHAFSFRRRLPPPLPWMLARIEAVTCGASDRVICLTRGDMDAADRLGISMARASVIPNGVDVTRFEDGDDRREEFGFARDAPVVGLVGRLVPQKDPLTFVDMARRVAQAEPQARFLLVGDGPLRQITERAVREAALDGRVMITGFRPDVPALLHTMDVVVLTSRWEGLPFAVLEAMAAARPVVASFLPGTAEVVHDGLTGRLVPPGDATQFAAAVIRLLRDPQARTEMGRRARARVRQEFSLSRMVDATAGVYTSMLAAAGVEASA